MQNALGTHTARVRASPATHTLSCGNTRSNVKSKNAVLASLAAEREQQKEAQRERRDAMPKEKCWEELYAQQQGGGGDGGGDGGGLGGGGLCGCGDGGSAHGSDHS